MVDENSARAEAESLLGLLQTGETVDSVRHLIGDGTPYRTKVRLHFDLLVCRLSSNRERLLRNVRQNMISERLQGEVRKLLRAGWSHAKIRATLPVGYRCVLTMSKTIGAPYLKPRGRGRRFTPELREQIRRAVEARQRSADIERSFKIDAATVLVFRHACGDFEDRRHWMKLSPEQVAQATAALRRGEKWRDVAANHNVSLPTLQLRVEYRKRGRTA